MGGYQQHLVLLRLGKYRDGLCRCVSAQGIGRELVAMFRGGSGEAKDADGLPVLH
jgi:hypothetical protein